MPPKGSDPSGPSERRKSTSFFSRPTLSNLNTDVANDGSKKDARKVSKRASMFGVSPSPHLREDYVPSPTGSEHSPKVRPRTLQKGRPSSIFGSLGKKNAFSFAEEDGDGSAEGLVGMGTTPESPAVADEHAHLFAAAGKTVLHHGEVQTTSGMFRKKKEYLVLTDTHLCRFKSQSRAADAFPSIPPVYGRSNVRHPSTTSIGSIHEAQSTASHASNESENRIPLRQIVTAYKLEDGKPFFTTEVVWLDEEYHGVGSIQLMLHDPAEADLWHTSLRAAAQKARLTMEGEPYPERVVEYLAAALELVSDYDSAHFKLYRVVRRSAKGLKASSDDLQKLGSSVFYLVIGINRVHLIPLPDFTEVSGRPLTSKTARNVFGIVTLVSMTVNYTDDRFELSFRTPMQSTIRLDMAASATTDIAAALVRALLYLKPQWLDYNFQFKGPQQLLDNLDTPVIEFEEDLGGFDRTLTAYCMAYNVNPANIRYSIDMEAEDAPEFRLCQAAHGGSYSRLELLAIFRSLRYNESFGTISFRGVDLEPLHSKFDALGTDHIAWTSRQGLSITKFFNITPQDKSLLYQEVQALALKSHRLRRLDFGWALPKRRPKDTFDIEGDSLEKDPGTEIVSGLLPVVRAQLTNVSWIVLSGIELGETDFDDIIPALDEVNSQIRAIECASCHLNDRGIMQLLSHMERQNPTLECINIADNPGKVHVERFQVALSRFAKIRRLDLSRITKTFNDEPLFKPEVMLSWRLEELNMNGVPTNQLTLESISTYLASSMSSSLRNLRMDQCTLTGQDIAILMRSMTHTPGVARDLHLSVSANRLEKGIRDIIQAIREDLTPAYLHIRMIEFVKEDHCKQLLQAVKGNKTLRLLDISKASLPYDASDETCDALRDLFAENDTLEEFDISGEHAHLEVARFGIGLSQALNGLKHNKTLKVLRIEYQNLGLEGANTLASVLEVNDSLTNVYCEHNDINLQGFTTLVNAVATNKSVVGLPFGGLGGDQGESLRRMKSAVTSSTSGANGSRGGRGGHGSVGKHGGGSMRKIMGVVKVGGHHHHGSGTGGEGKEREVSAQDMDAFVRVMAEKWQVQNERLAAFLNRNRALANGWVEGEMGEEGGWDGNMNEMGVGRWQSEWQGEGNVEGGRGEGEGNGDMTVMQEMMRPADVRGSSDQSVLEMVLGESTPKGEVGDPMLRHHHHPAANGHAQANGQPNDQGNGHAQKSSSIGKENGAGKDATSTGTRKFELPVIKRGEKMFDLDAEAWGDDEDDLVKEG